MAPSLHCLVSLWNLSTLPRIIWNHSSLPRIIWNLSTLPRIIWNHSFLPLSYGTSLHCLASLEHSHTASYHWNTLTLPRIIWNTFTLPRVIGTTLFIASYHMEPLFIASYLYGTVDSFSTHSNRVPQLPTTLPLSSTDSVKDTPLKPATSGLMTNKIWSHLFNLVIFKNCTFDMVSFDSFLKLVEEQAKHYSIHGYLAPFPSPATITGSILQNEEYWQQQKIHQVCYVLPNSHCL